MKKFWKRKEQKVDKVVTCDSPYYVYSGPMDTREDGSQWTDYDNYKKGGQKTPTGSIHIIHPDIKMLCCVTDNETFPGFLINCKDNEGNSREVQVYFNENNKELVVCTSCKSDQSLDLDDQIHRRYKVPFEKTLQPDHGSKKE